MSEWHLSKYNLFANLPNTNLIGCVNLLKGTCSTLTPEDVLKLHNLVLDKRFIDQGFIVNYDEFDYIEIVARKAENSGSLGLTICPTLNCNFDCPYCFENHRTGEMKLEVQDNIIKFIETNLINTGGKRLSVTWFGGEPLLKPTIIENLSDRIIKLCNEKKIQYSATIVTNGYLLTQDIADMLYDKKVQQYQITFDGLYEMHDKTRHLKNGQSTFNKIVDNLKTLKIKSRVNIRYNTYIENFNKQDEVKKFIQNLAKESGNNISYYPAIVVNNDVAKKRDCQFNYLSNEDFGDVVIDIDINKFNSFKGTFCGAQNFSFITIDELGNLYKCWEDVGKLEHSFGNINRFNINNFLRTSSNLEPLLKYINSSNLTDKDCIECIWFPLCRGGCPNKRIYSEKVCLSYKNKPEEFVIKLINHKQKQDEQRQKCNKC